MAKATDFITFLKDGEETYPIVDIKSEVEIAKIAALNEKILKIREKVEAKANLVGKEVVRLRNAKEYDLSDDLSDALGDHLYDVSRELGGGEFERDWESGTVEFVEWESSGC